MTTSNARAEAGGFEIRRVDNPEKSDSQELLGLIVAHNEAFTDGKRAKRYIGFYDGDDWIGGIQFYWYGSDAYIELLAVRENWRNRGIATRLMAAAEEELRQRNCRQIFVDTAPFQAAAFYPKLGYELAGEIPDYLGGQTKYTYRKYLAEKGRAA